MKFLSYLMDKTIKFFFLILISVLLIIIPLKILSYGWSPNYANLISAVLVKNNDIPISQGLIKESINSNTSIYYNSKESILVFIVVFCFIIFNLIGLSVSRNNIAWFASMSFLMLFNTKFIIRLLNCSPQILLCMLLMLMMALFYDSFKKNPKTSAFVLLVYIFILRFIFPPSIYSMNEINISYKYIWALPFEDFYPLLFENLWIVVLPFIVWISSYKQKTKIIEQFNDPILFVILVLQLIINFGYIDLALFRDSLLLFWASHKFSNLISLIYCFKETRVKCCMSLFVLIVFFLLATHDGLGRYSKHSIETMPVDFALKELKDWKPGENGVIFNDDVDFAFSQYCRYPEAKHAFVYMNSFSLFEKEKENLLNIKRMLNYKITPLPDYYEFWVNQMNPSDRLVTSAKINGLENIEWLQCGRKYWIGRLKN